MRAFVALALASLFLTAACTSDPGDRADGQDGPVVTRTPVDPVTVLDSASPAATALLVSRTLYERSEVVVLTAHDREAHAAATRAATALGAPVLEPGSAVPAEIKRLGAGTVLGFGDVPEVPGLIPVTNDDAAVDQAVRDLPRGTPPARKLIAFVRTPAPNRAAITSARNAGADVVRSAHADPRADVAAREALTEQPDAQVIGLGRPFRHGLDYQVTAVRDGLEQPGGGLLAFPGRHVVALYGHPKTAALGLLGEQGVAKSVARAQRVAARYQKLTKDPVVPAFEVIATVASAGKGKDKNYSAETSVKDLQPLVRAAHKAGLYVVLDLQPGRTDFLTQAKQYESLLRQPHVGLALDPEWRLTKKQKHLRQIGSVSAAEINRTSAWLANLTRSEKLPQKLFVVHQFSTAMVRDRQELVTSHPELSTVIHVDGQGSPGAKKGTWATVRRDAPAGVHWGWKNFHDEDAPMLTAKQTWRIRPRPDLVTYQ